MKLSSYRRRILIIFNVTPLVVTSLLYLDSLLFTRSIFDIFRSLIIFFFRDVGIFGDSRERRLCGNNAALWLVLPIVCLFFVFK